MTTAPAPTAPTAATAPSMESMASMRKKWDTFNEGRDYNLHNLERMQTLAHDLRRDAENNVKHLDLKYETLRTSTPVLFAKCCDPKFPMSLIDKLIAHMVKVRNKEMTDYELGGELYKWKA